MNKIKKHVGTSTIAIFVLIFVCGCSTKNSDNQKYSTSHVEGIGDTIQDNEGNYITLNSYEINPGQLYLNFSMQLTEYSLDYLNCYSSAYNSDYSRFSLINYNLDFEGTVAYNGITLDENNKFSYSGDFTFIFSTGDHTFINGEEIHCGFAFIYKGERYLWGDFVITVLGLTE